MWRPMKSLHQQSAEGELCVHVCWIMRVMQRINACHCCAVQCRQHSLSASGEGGVCNYRTSIKLAYMLLACLHRRSELTQVA